MNDRQTALIAAAILHQGLGHSHGWSAEVAETAEELLPWLRGEHVYFTGVEE